MRFVSAALRRKLAAVARLKLSGDAAMNGRRLKFQSGFERWLFSGEGRYPFLNVHQKKSHSK